MIAYVGTRDLPVLREEDIRLLSVVNLAFGHIKNDRIVYETEGNEEHLKRIKHINPDCALVLSVGGWSAGGFSEAAATQAGREQVAQSALELVKQYSLDGIDLDYSLVLL